jgi:CelD/BcsL family acetyltransferase involved in cellulose biosynthesis
LGRVIVARSAQQMDGIRSAWESLCRQGEYTVFQSFEWNRSAAELFGRTNAPCVIFAETAGGAAIVPAAITREGMTLIGEELFDYRDVLAGGDDDALALAWQTLGDSAGESEFRAKGVRQSALRERFKKCSEFTSRASVEFFANAPTVRCCAPSSKQRHNRLERNFERMRAAGCEMRLSTGSDGALVKEILKLKASQDEKSLFHDPLRIEMVCEMATVLENGCEIFALIDGSTIVAGLITFIDGDWRRFYTTYYDARWAKFSPGVSLVNHVIGLSLEAGRNVDLMTGEQPYKLRFATSREALFTLHAPAAALRAMVPDRASELPIAA